VRVLTSYVGVSLDGFIAADGFIHASWVTEVYRVSSLQTLPSRWVQ
jgi:hypothetical protein